MRIARYSVEGGMRFGVLAGGLMYPIPRAIAAAGPGMITHDGIDALRHRGEGILEAPLPVASLTLDAPVESPRLVVSVAMNYRRRAARLKRRVPACPELSTVCVQQIVGHGGSIVAKDRLPARCEASLAIVLGSGGRNIAVGAARACILGFACANVVGMIDARADILGDASSTAVRRALAVGPCIVTVDELPDPQQLTIRGMVNGRTLQHSNTADMIFSVDELVAHASMRQTLNAGDIILTGTPEAVAMTAKEDTWLRPGDVVSVEIESVGELRTALV